VDTRVDVIGVAARVDGRLFTPAGLLLRTVRAGA
jgi:hypothetical protein